MDPKWYSARFAAKGGISRGEANRINEEAARRLPSPEDYLTHYPTRESLQYNAATNRLGFNDKQLRLMCTQRGLLPLGTTANARMCIKELLRWRESKISAVPLASVAAGRLFQPRAVIPRC